MHFSHDIPVPIISMCLKRERHQLRIQRQRQYEMTSQHQSQRQTREEPANLPSHWHRVRKNNHHNNPTNHNHIHKFEIPDNLWQFLPKIRRFQFL